MFAPVAGILAGRDERREPDQNRYSRSGAKRRDFTILTHSGVHTVGCLAPSSTRKAAIDVTFTDSAEHPAKPNDVGTHGCGNKWTTGAASTARTEAAARWAPLKASSAPSCRWALQTCTSDTKSRLSAGHPIDGRVPARYPERHTLSSRVPDHGPDLLFG